MKKFLLSIVLVFIMDAAHSQIYLNEMYVQPGSGNHEFIELVNTDVVPVSVNCYTLVTYFSDGSERGLYVINLPNTTIPAMGFLLGSSVNPFLNYQGGQAVADFSWNDGFISRYVFNGTSLQLDNSGAPYLDVFTKSGAAAMSKKSSYAVFLFSSNNLVDGFFGAQNNSQVPDYILQLGQLNHAGPAGCVSLLYNFADMDNEPNSKFGNVLPSSGTDNGYYRKGIGPCPGNNNNNWEKASAPAEHTPGMPNPSATINSGGGVKLTVSADCIENSTILNVSITGGPASVYPLNVTLYNDLNMNGQYDGGDVQITTTSYPDNAGLVVLTKPASAEFLVVIVDAPDICFDQSVAIQCQPGISLPVLLRSFTARRSGGNVTLNWETSTEINNSGFDVQRKTGSDTWESIAFVNSKADDGNSNVPLNYSLIDQNNSKAVTQYRLRQLDLDGKSRFSETRTVRGDGQAAEMIVYPNPSSNGQVNIVFDGSDGLHDITLSDMSGRIIRQWSNIGNNSLQIRDLLPGLYSIHVYNRETGIRSVEKVVVNKR